MAVPPVDARLHFADVVVTETLVERRQSRKLSIDELAVDDFADGVGGVRQHMIVLKPFLPVPAFQATGEEVGGVRGDIGAKQVERHAVVEIQVALDGWQINHAEIADLVGILDLVSRHHVGGPLHDAADAGLADEHVMCFLGQHEPARARQRIEPRLGQ